MQSSFNSPTRRARGGSSIKRIDETYNLRGLNLTDPDEIMPQGDSPNTINSRMYARNDGESRVANRTRMGSTHLSTPIGSAANVANAGTATGDLAFSVTKGVAVPFTPSATKSLTRLDTNIKKIGFATGHVLVEIYTNVGGFPGLRIAEGSILGSTITTTYQALTAYFIDAPTLTSGTAYFAVYSIQDNGTGSYYLNKTAVVTTSVISSINDGVSWTSEACSVRFTTHLATTGGVKGYTIRYPSDITATRILAAQLGSLYQIPKVGGVPVLVDSTINSNSQYVRFDQSQDDTLFVDGFSRLKAWDGSTTPTVVPNTPITAPEGVLFWNNRTFIYKTTRVEFSELGDRTNWPSVNFFYVPITNPKSADHIAGWKVFQDNMVVLTHLTKYQVIGSNIANFTYKEAVGTKGAASQEGITADRNFIYFISDDKQIYRWNGIEDQLLSLNIESELQGIQDVSKVRLHMYRNQLRVYYPKTPSATNNRMLLLDIELSNPSKGDWRWFLDTDHPVVGSADMYLDQDDPLIEFSSLVGRVYYGEKAYSDLGKPLDWKWWSNYKAYGSGSSKKRVKRFRPVIRTEDADYAMLIGKDMDFLNKPDMRLYNVSGEGAKFGQFLWGDGTRWGKKSQVMNPAGMSGRGNFIQYRFERRGVETPVELYGYIAQYKVGKPK